MGLVEHDDGVLVNVQAQGAARGRVQQGAVRHAYDVGVVGVEGGARCVVRATTLPPGGLLQLDWGVQRGESLVAQQVLARARAGLAAAHALRARALGARRSGRLRLVQLAAALVNRVRAA